MHGFAQQRLKLPSAPEIPPCAQRAQGIAVIALFSRYYLGTLTRACLDVVLPGKFDSRFNGFGTTADKVDTLYPGRRMSHQSTRQFLGRLGGEKAGMCVGNAIDLILDGFE